MTESPVQGVSAAKTPASILKSAAMALEDEGYLELANDIRSIPVPAQLKPMPVIDEMVDRAMSRFHDAVNSMVSCPRCNGIGYHHGFGEGGREPDWCSTCGGCQSVAEFDDKAAMREALTAALAFPSTTREAPEISHRQFLSSARTTDRGSVPCAYPGCEATFKDEWACAQHRVAVHNEGTPTPSSTERGGK